MTLMDKETDFISNQKKTLYTMRLLAQIAEKFGWAIGGFAAANALAGPVGISLFGLMMVLFASAQTTLLRLLKINLGASHIRIALILRVASFGLLALASWLDNFPLMLLGSAFSGLFVGLFWSTFYKFKNGSIEGWFLLEKTMGMVLTILSGLIVAGCDTTIVFVVSMIASTCSYVTTFSLASQSLNVDSDENTIAIFQDKSSIQIAATLSILEGILFAMVVMTRRLVVLTETIVIPGLSGILSETLFIAAAGFLGALFTHYSKERVHFPIRLYCGLTICMIGALMACTGITEYWIVGLVILSIGLSIIFPLTHSSVRELLGDSHHAMEGFRESWRNPGRLVGSLVAVWLWLTFESISMPFIIALALIIAYGRLSHDRLNIS